MAQEATKTIISMNIEALLNLKQALEGAEETHLNALSIYSGHHPEHGKVRLIIPPLGDGILLLPN